MTYPPAIGRQLDRCDRCGRKTHKKDLHYTQVEFAKPVGENLFSYSTYEGTYWTVSTGSYVDDSSIGPYGDRARCRVSDDNTVTEILGSPTFSPTTGGITVEAASAMDLSSYSSVVFSAIVGPYHGNASRDPGYSADPYITIGFYTGANYYYSTWASPYQMMRVWMVFNSVLASANSVTYSAAIPFVWVNEAADDYYYFIEDLQLESNVTVPGNFIRTNGSAITTTVPGRNMVVEKLCNRDDWGCNKLRILRRSTQIGHVDPEHEDEPPTYLQET